MIIAMKPDRYGELSLTGAQKRSVGLAEGYAGYLKRDSPGWKFAPGGERMFKRTCSCASRFRCLTQILRK